jgi:hypothetical protein
MSYGMTVFEGEAKLWTKLFCQIYKSSLYEKFIVTSCLSIDIVSMQYSKTFRHSIYIILFVEQKLSFVTEKNDVHVFCGFL